MTKISKEDEERGKRLIEEFKKAQKEHNEPVYVHQKEKWDLPPGDDAIGPPTDDDGGAEKPAKKP
jgi:molybdenum-dependent DNA-binding transcriptional regulator ModE